MTVLEDLGKLSSAEDIFRYLEVASDPRVLAVSRLHILRKWRQYLAQEALAGLPEEQVRTVCRGLLEKAHQDFVERTPIEERLFKVHQDAVRPKTPRPLPFVSLSTLSARASAAGPSLKD